MKRIRQFNVGNVTIKKDGDTLEFNGIYHAQDPDHVIIAMIAVSRYLKWHNGPFTNWVLMDWNGEENKTATQYLPGTYQEWHHVWLGDVTVEEAIWQDGKKPYVSKVTTSTTGHTIYVNHKKVMHICSTGNTDWCKLSKKQLMGAINDWYYNNNTILIPSYGFSILPMFTVKKVDPYVEFDEKDFEQADKSFIEFMESHCKVAGSYSFRNEEFRKGTGLPTAGLVWHYLTDRHEFTTFNGLCVSSADQNEDTIDITLC